MGCERRLCNRIAKAGEALRSMEPGQDTSCANLSLYWWKWFICVLERTTVWRVDTGVGGSSDGDAWQIVQGRSWLKGGAIFAHYRILFVVRL